MWLCQTRRETDPVSTNQPHQKLDEHKSLKQRSLPCGYKWHHNLHRSNVFHHCPCSTLTRPLLMHMYCATHTQMCRLASKFHLLSACIKQHWSWKVWHAFFHVRITCTTNACKSLNFLSHTHSLSLSLSLSFSPLLPSLPLHKQNNLAHCSWQTSMFKEVLGKNEDEWTEKDIRYSTDIHLTSLLCANKTNNFHRQINNRLNIKLFKVAKIKMRTCFHKCLLPCFVNAFTSNTTNDKSTQHKFTQASHMPVVHCRHDQWRKHTAQIYTSFTHAGGFALNMISDKSTQHAAHIYTSFTHAAGFTLNMISDKSTQHKSIQF